MKKINKPDWFTEGFSILESEGFSKITIDNLCSKLQVTKGSFYHHFKNTEGYVTELMDYWLEEYTLSIIHQINSLAGVKAKKKIIDKLVLDRSMKVEQVIRAWGYSNNIVNERVREADKIRLKCLIELEIEEGKSRVEAKDTAMLTYATLVGLQQLFPNLSRKEQNRLNQFYSSKF